MLAIPAIDLKDGKVVRLLQGKYEQVTVYSHDPLEIAKDWQKQGANRLHIVDLDGALSGEIKNLTAIRQIIEGISIPIQLGGGLRTSQDIAGIIAMGAKWAILGSKACDDLEFVQKMTAKFGKQIIASIDVKYRKVAVHGWRDTTDIEDADLIKNLQGVGVKSFIYTDISRDGTLAGINTEGIENVLGETGASIIYSGGISTVQDAEKLKRLEKQGLAGVIIGKALYEQKINLAQIQKMLGGKLEL